MGRERGRGGGERRRKGEERLEGDDGMGVGWDGLVGAGLVEWTFFDWTFLFDICYYYYSSPRPMCFKNKMVGGGNETEKRERNDSKN